MGAMVTIKYDNSRVTNPETKTLSEGVKTLIEELLGESDVFLYADSSDITIGADPIEVFIQVNSKNVLNLDKLLSNLVEKLSIWKQQNNFDLPINLNIIPVVWHSKIGV